MNRGILLLIGDECSCPIIAPFWNGKECVGLDKVFD
jgi:hypothetical protein